jgi:anti-sigma factor RsiW
MELEHNNGACPEFEALLEDHLSGELGGADAEKLAKHMESCAACGDALEEAAASTRLLHVAEASPDPGPGFSRDVMARIRTEMDRRGEEKSIWLPIISVAWRFAASATLALVLLVTFYASRHTQSQTQLAQTHDLFADPTSPPTSRDDVLRMVVETNHGN